MESNLIHDRGRGPELIGTRITVYTLLPHLLNPTATERELCDLYRLIAEQVAALRAYILTHYNEVMKEHRRIEQRIQDGIRRQENDPVFNEQVRENSRRFKLYQEWFAEKNAVEAKQPVYSSSSLNEVGTPQFPNFREWVIVREAGGEE